MTLSQLGKTVIAVLGAAIIIGGIVSLINTQNKEKARQQVEIAQKENLSK